MEELIPGADQWVTVGRPGFAGRDRDLLIEDMNFRYGEDQWRLVHELGYGRILADIDQIIRTIFIPGYVAHFIAHPAEAEFLTQNYSYAYDKDLITRAQAFNPGALYRVPEVPNQVHHVALVLALEDFLGLPFRGSEPIKVREGKAGTPKEQWPAGWQWSPGRIAAVRQDLIPQNTGIQGWWAPGTIEDFYQKTKVLQVR